MGNPSVNKRQKERERKDRQRDKDAARKLRRDDKATNPVDRVSGEDPDIADRSRSPRSKALRPSSRPRATCR
jgi:hypothetical protein